MKMNFREIQFSEFLENKHMTWVFEPMRFVVGDSTYRPDFYCPDNDTFYVVEQGRVDPIISHVVSGHVRFPTSEKGDSGHPRINRLRS